MTTTFPPPLSPTTHRASLAKGFATRGTSLNGSILQATRIAAFAYVLAITLSACTDDARRAEEPVNADRASTNAPARPSEGAGQDDKGTHAAPTERKLYFEGTLGLIAKDPAEVVDHAAALVQATGGYVKSRTTSTAVLKVPVATFAKTFATMQTLGLVTEKRLHAADVTDAYNDTELRKKMLLSSIKKLETLYAAATSVSDRLALLQEIGELQARLDEAERQIATMAQMAAYSQITLQVKEPVRAVASFRPTPLGPLRWIDRLTPGQSLAATTGKNLELPTPTGFVVLPKKKYWAAESATTASLTATRLVNEPFGDAAFWRETLKKRLNGRYAVVAVETHGVFEIVRLRSVDDEGYRYDVGVSVDGKNLLVTEAFFPSADDERRFSPAVFAALTAYGTVERKGS